MKGKKSQNVRVVDEETEAIINPSYTFFFLDMILHKSTDSLTQWSKTRETLCENYGRKRLKKILNFGARKEILNI